MGDQDFDISEEVLNLSTNRWIKKNGKLFQKLLREGYKYTSNLSHYLEDIPPIDIDKYSTIYLSADFFHSALIPPLSILARRRDICRRYPISIGTAVEGGMNLPNALYDAFSKADVLGPEHILAIARMLQ
ncbi:5220_t:CDS:2 [Diversispora eburnea]|uniref:5220_t:CDS:1 n=1 Tax=Diversispora eburnea TaxID=1213867 RepID=A0A9N9CT04_9GLOM|nr:5220_t:CDS:2 [Diversispora eburnea]